MNFKKPKLCNTKVIKYGKKIDMRSLNRDLNNIREMKQNRKEASLKNLNEYDSEGSYFCPICESEDYKFYVNIYGYQYCECQKCKSIFLANLPNVGELYLGKEEVAVEHYIDKEIFDKRKKLIANPKLDFVLDVLTKYYGENFKIKSWLDIGCAGGGIIVFS